MIIERRKTPRESVKPKQVPVCKVEKIGNYGLYFAYKKGDTRPAPGTNYLNAWLNWCKRFVK